MAGTKIQKEMTELVENFIGLWNRYYTLYLEGISTQDITSEKENEFLKFQGTMVEQLAKLLELDKGRRFDVHDMVMAVINEVVSLDLYTRMSEFQIKRVKKQWQEAIDELEKLYRFCETYDLKVDKVEKITEVKRKNPYWDPTSGSMREVLSRLTVAPVTFFQGIKTGLRPENMGSFIFLTFFIPFVIILTIVFMVNFNTVKIIGRNVCVEAGLLASDETGFVPGLMIAAAVFAGLLVIALVLSIVLFLLHYLLSLFMHLGFRLTGGKEKYRETYKVVTYGAAPVVAVITAPYTVILQIIGASKVHKYPYALAAIGWIMGMTLLVAVLFTAAGAAFYFTGNVPPVGEYAYVLDDQTPLLDKHLDEARTLYEGAWLALSDPDNPEVKTVRKSKKGKINRFDVYEVEYKDKEYYVEEEMIELRNFSWGGMPTYILERTGHSIGAARRFLNKLIEKYKE